jgi:hypothetical protein
VGGRRLLFVHHFIATAPNVRSDHEKYDAIKNIDWLHILHGLLPWRRLEWSVPLSGSIECPLELNRQVFGNFRLGNYNAANFDTTGELYFNPKKN